MGALKNKTILLVTHQVDFLHNVDCIMVSVNAQFFSLTILWQPAPLYNLIDNMKKGYFHHFMQN